MSEENKTKNVDYNMLVATTGLSEGTLKAMEVVANQYRADGDFEKLVINWGTIIANIEDEAIT